MSIWASIDLVGSFKVKDRFQAIMEFLKSHDAAISFNGQLQAFKDSGDGWDYYEIEIFNDDFEFAKQNFINGNICALCISLSIECADRLISISSPDDNSLNIQIIGNRKKIFGYHTDYSWYYTNIIHHINESIFSVSAITYQDVC